MLEFYSGLAEIHDVMGDLETEVNDLLHEAGEGGEVASDSPLGLLGFTRYPPSKDEEQEATVEVRGVGGVDSCPCLSLMVFFPWGSSFSLG